MPAWGPQPHQIGTLAIGQTGAAGGPTLILRRLIFASQTDVAPAKSATAIIRSTGPGSGAGTSNSGGGGAFARTNNIPCPAGTSLVATVGTPGAGGGTGGAATPCTVSIGGTIVNQAAGGRAGGLGGLASACIGDVTYSGGNQNQAGVNGGEAGASPLGDGGGSAGERNAVDAVMLGARGCVSINGSPGILLRAGFPGGGGGKDDGNQYPGAAGLIIIDYMSA